MGKWAYRCVSLPYPWSAAAAGAELEGTRRQLTAAEETVAELAEVNEAAQVAIDQLRARISAAEDRF